MGGIVDFFLDKQRIFNKIAQTQQNIEDLRALCDLKCMNKKSFKVFSHFYKSEKNGLIKFDVSVYPKEYESLFCQKSLPHGNISNHQAIFYGPCDPQADIEPPPKSESFYNIRMGFFEEEYDVLKTIYEGFDSVVIYIHRLDKYQIQYLVELGRDYHCNVILMIHDKKDMEKALETDATCFCVSGFHTDNFQPHTVPLYKIPKRVPDNCLLLSFLKNCTADEERILKDLNYKAIISL